MSYKRKALGFALALFLLGSALVFGTAGAEETSAEVPRLHFVHAGLGPDQAVYDEVLGIVNEKLETEIGATVDFTYWDWSDYYTKVRLAVAADENYDAYFTDKHFFGDLFPNGAFAPLEEILPTATPTLYASRPQVYWEGLKYTDGHIYLVPPINDFVPAFGFVYRRDLADQYGVGEITTPEDAEKYLTAAKADFTLPLNIGPKTFWIVEYMEWWQPTANRLKEAVLKGRMPYMFVYWDDLSHPHPYWESPEFMDFLHTQRRWYEEGFWSRNVLADSSTDSIKMFEAENSAAAIANAGQANALWKRLQANQPDWEIDWVPMWFTKDDGTYDNFKFHTPTAWNMSVSASSDYPVLALKILEKLNTDREIFDLTQYGIRGTNWDLDDDGMYVDLTPDITESFGHGFRSVNLKRDRAQDDPNSWPLIANWMKEWDQNALPNVFGMVPFDSASVSAQWAAVENVAQEYWLALSFGTIDPDQGMEDFLKALDSAGWDEVKAAWESQWNAWLASKTFDGPYLRK